MKPELEYFKLLNQIKKIDKNAPLKDRMNQANQIIKSNPFLQEYANNPYHNNFSKIQMNNVFEQYGNCLLGNQSGRRKDCAQTKTLQDENRFHNVRGFCEGNKSSNNDNSKSESVESDATEKKVIKAENSHVDWSKSNYNNPKQILYLLQIARNNLSNEGINDLVYDVKSLLSKIKLSKDEKRILNEYRFNQLNVSEISQKLKLNRSYVQMILSNISKRIAKQYASDYETWLQLNYVKRTWKRCSKCGKQKPIMEFGRNFNTKDKHQSVCKQCDAERKQFKEITKKTA